MVRTENEMGRITELTLMLTVAKVFVISLVLDNSVVYTNVTTLVFRSNTDDII